MNISMKKSTSFFEAAKISVNADNLYEKEKNCRIRQKMIIVLIEE